MISNIEHLKQAEIKEIINENQVLNENIKSNKKIMNDIRNAIGGIKTNKTPSIIMLE